MMHIAATTSRLIDASVEIMGEPDPDDLAFLHVVLALAACPIARPPAAPVTTYAGTGAPA